MFFYSDMDAIYLCYELLQVIIRCIFQSRPLLYISLLCKPTRIPQINILTALHKHIGTRIPIDTNRKAGSVVKGNQHVIPLLADSNFFKHNLSLYRKFAHILGIHYRHLLDGSQVYRFNVFLDINAEH